jgi:hypothetical protein
MKTKEADGSRGAAAQSSPGRDDLGYSMPSLTGIRETSAHEEARLMNFWLRAPLQNDNKSCTTVPEHLGLHSRIWD